MNNTPNNPPDKIFFIVDENKQYDIRQPFLSHTDAEYEIIRITEHFSGIKLKILTYKLEKS